MTADRVQPQVQAIVGGTFDANGEDRAGMRAQLRAWALEGEQAFEQHAQDLVNDVARLLIEQRPDIAEQEPRLIGETAKQLVFASMVWATATN